MKQLPNIARGDGPQAQNRAATITTEILGIVRHALLAWWHRDHHANPAAARIARCAVSDRATILARALLQTITRYIVDEPALQARIAEQLRDELHDIKQQNISEIRPEDE